MKKLSHTSTWKRTFSLILVTTLKCLETQLKVTSCERCVPLVIGSSHLYVFKHILRTSIHFVGLLIPLFWTSGDFCLGFQCQGGSPHLLLCHLHATDFLDSPLVLHLLISRWPSCFYHLLAHLQALVGLESGIYHVTSLQHVTRQALYRISYSNHLYSSVPVYHVETPHPFISLPYLANMGVPPVNLRDLSKNPVNYGKFTRCMPI